MPITYAEVATGAASAGAIISGIFAYVSNRTAQEGLRLAKDSRFDSWRPVIDVRKALDRGPTGRTLDASNRITGCRYPLIFKNVSAGVAVLGDEPFQRQTGKGIAAACQPDQATTVANTLRPDETLLMWLVLVGTSGTPLPDQVVYSQFRFKDVHGRSYHMAIAMRTDTGDVVEVVTEQDA